MQHRGESVLPSGSGISLTNYEQDQISASDSPSTNSSSRKRSLQDKNENLDEEELNSTEDNSNLENPKREETRQREETMLGPSVATEPSSSNPAAETLTLDRLLASVAECYPEIEIAIGEISTAAGNSLAAEGAFDRILSAHSISQPLGFYQTYRNGIGLSRPLFHGGEVFGTYRIGDGNFEPWFGERETNEGGEFKAGFSIPLAKDRNIDARRAKLFSAQQQQLQVESNVESRLLFFQRIASQAYWDWVVAGRVVDIQRRLIQLAEERVDQIELRIEKGDLAEIAGIDNARLLAARKNSLIKARRSLEKAAIKLSMFFRDENCNPIIADESSLPTEFPKAYSIGEQQLMDDINRALSLRPELAELVAAREEVCIDLRYARNLTLPKIDLNGFAGQDVGGAASSLGDKTPFELQLGVLAEVPLERREGLGKIEAAQGKLTQIDAKLQFTSDKIRAEIQDAASAVNAALEQIEQSGENLRLTLRSLELGRIAFDEGDIDLIELNIRETAVAEAALFLLDAQLQYQFARAAYSAALSDNQLN